MKRIVLTILAIVSLFTATAVIQAPSSVVAAPKDEVCKGIGAANGTGGCNGGPSLTALVRNIITIFSFIIGVVAVIMMMVGGFKYITSGGDSGNITSAKNTIVYAVIGLVVVAFSQSIVHFVLTSV